MSEPDRTILEPSAEELAEAEALPAWSDHRGERDRDPDAPHPWRGGEQQ